MAGITTRKPEEAIENYKAVVSLVKILQDLFNDPASIKRIEEQLTSVELLSQEQQTQLAEAQETILKAAEIREELQDERKAHDAFVKEQRDTVLLEHGNLNSAKAEFETYKTKESEKLKNLENELVAESNKIETKIYNFEKQKYEFEKFKELSEATLEETTKRLIEKEAVLSKREEVLLAREVEISKKEEKLAVDITAFEEHKAKIDQLLKATL